MYPGQPGHAQQQFDARLAQGNPLQQNVANIQFNQAQMQSFNGYNSMPPPGTTMQQANQQYQTHMRNNSQQMPPSPGYAQSPNAFHTPTPPGGMGQTFYPQQVPTSQPMSAGSPQVANNPLQQKQSGNPQADPAKLESRIDLLLELNRILFQEIIQLQESGKAGAVGKNDPQTGQQSPTASEADGESEKKADDGKKGPAPSREYIECMLRLRGNFAYLTNLATPNSTKNIPRPTIMEPLSPNDSIAVEVQESIKGLYKQLKESFVAGPLNPVQQSPQQAQHGLSTQQQAQNMQQQILQHQQQMAAQAQAAQGGNMAMNMNMNPQLLQQQQQQQQQLQQQQQQQQQQQMMARAMAMQNQQQMGLSQSK